MAGRGIQLVLLAIAMGAAGYVRTAMSPLQEAMRVALDLSDNQIALLQGPAIGIPVILAAVPLGLLIDRYSRVRLLSGLVALSAIGSGLTAVSSDYSLLLVARGLAGTAGLAVLPVVFSLLSDHYPPAQRGRVTTVAIIGQVAGNSAAFAFGGLLLAMTDPASQGWRWAMSWLTAPLIAVLLLLILMLREPARTGVVVKNPSMGQLWDELRQYRTTIAPIVAGIVLAEVAIGAMIIWAAPMFTRVYQLRAEEVGAIMALGMLLSGILGPLIGGPLADFCQRRGGPGLTTAALAVLSIVAIPVSLFALVSSVSLASFLLAAAMTLMLIIVVMGMALFTIVIPSEIRGLCTSVLVALEILFALAVGPPAVSLLSGTLGGLAMVGTALSTVCVVSTGLAAAAFSLGARSCSRMAASPRVESAAWTVERTEAM